MDQRKPYEPPAVEKSEPAERKPYEAPRVEESASFQRLVLACSATPATPECDSSTEEPYSG